MYLNIRTFSEAKWKKLQNYTFFKDLDVIILTEHHLPSTFRPKEVVTDGWTFRSVSGPTMTGPLAHLHRGGIAILTRQSRNLSVKQVTVADPASGFMHQAATWTLTSPNLTRPLHVTGVYVSPHADRTEELFNLLSHQNVFPPDEIHLFVGDFNAHTQSEIENHVLASDNIPTRIGDGHKPERQDACLSGQHLSSAQRGRLLFRFLQAAEHVLLNGRFQHPVDSSIPYTFQRANSSDTSIVDYITLAKCHFPTVISCKVVNTQRTRGSRISDHNPILVHINLPDLPALPPSSRSVASHEPWQ